MKTAFCMHVFSNEKMEETIPKLAAMGYEGLEFWEQYLSQADLSRLKKVLEDNKVEVAQLCPYFDFTSGEERWQWSVKMAETYVQRCLQLETSLIRTYTECPWMNRMPIPPKGEVLKKSAQASDAHWDAAIRGLKKICSMGKKHGIRFALETTHGLLDSSGSVLKLIEKVEADNLGVNLQLPLSGDREKDIGLMDSVEKLGEHVIHIHANNWKNADMKEYSFLDEGFIDYETVVRRLNRFGFKGYVSVEHATHGGKHEPLETATHEIAYLKRLKMSLS